VTTHVGWNKRTNWVNWKAGGRRVAASAMAGIGFALVAGASALGPVASASGTTQTLHFFSKNVSDSWTTASGQPIPGGPSQSNPPAPGDQLEQTDLDYVGTHTHHARNWTATDHLSCVVNSQSQPVCQGEVAIGGSMVLATATPTGSAQSTFEVVGGTGAFQGVSGTVASDNYSPNSEDSDITITLRQS
jgi:hypothetical protein